MTFVDVIPGDNPAWLRFAWNIRWSYSITHFYDLNEKFAI